MSSKPSQTDIIREASRLRTLSTGSATSAQIDDRIAEVRKILKERCRDRFDLKRVVDNVISTCEFVPTPAKVGEVIDALRESAMPFWQSPPPLPARTRREVLEDMEFQRQFKISHPRLSAAADERIAELRQELAELEGVSA